MQLLLSAPFEHAVSQRSRQNTMSIKLSAKLTHIFCVISNYVFYCLQYGRYQIYRRAFDNLIVFKYSEKLLDKSKLLLQIITRGF